MKNIFWRTMKKNVITGIGLFLFTLFLFEMRGFYIYHYDMNYRDDPYKAFILAEAWLSEYKWIGNFITVPIACAFGITSICEYILILIHLYKENKLTRKIAYISTGITITIIGIILFTLHSNLN